MVLARFLPRDEQFFDQFQEAADNAVDVTRVLVDVVAAETDRERNVHHLRDLEHRGDEITHRVFSALNSTFVTPLDRDDIRDLAVTFDDGYRDNLEFAYPILKQYEVPFAIYVATSFADRVGEMWWLALEAVIARNPMISLLMNDREHWFECGSVGENYWCPMLSSSRARASVVRRRHSAASIRAIVPSPTAKYWQLASRNWTHSRCALRN